jgi:hypothetical protein
LGRRIAGIVGIGSRECVVDALRMDGLKVMWMGIVAVVSVGVGVVLASGRGGSRGMLPWPSLVC